MTEAELLADCRDDSEKWAAAFIAKAEQFGDPLEPSLVSDFFHAMIDGSNSLRRHDQAIDAAQAYRRAEHYRERYDWLFENMHPEAEARLDTERRQWLAMKPEA